MSVIMYSKPGCRYCDQAEKFFEDNNIKYSKIILDVSSHDYENQRNFLFDTYNYRKFPLIIIGKTFVGGYEDLIHAKSTMHLHDLLKEIGQELEVDF